MLIGLTKPIMLLTLSVDQAVYNIRLFTSVCGSIINANISYYNLAISKSQAAITAEK